MFAGSDTNVPKAEGTPMVAESAADSASVGVCAVLWFDGPELAPKLRPFRSV